MHIFTSRAFTSTVSTAAPICVHLNSNVAMPNKSKKNAFCFFMQDFKIKEERKNGRRFSGGFSTELASLASEKWTVRTSEHFHPNLDNPPPFSYV